MRLRCLKLIRYGHFTDFFLDFKEQSQNSSDFHIIFGENEAGKSTAINGFFELLFGIPNQSKYGFHHSYDNLRIGAILELNNKTIELSRVKGRRDTLRDAEDKPIPEDILTSALYGHSATSYPTMFCLNEETLEKGGEEILASKGDVGRLLFTGTAGLSDLSKVLQELQDRANQIYKEGRSSSEISSLKQQLEQLDDKRKKMDTQVTAYRHLANELQRAGEAYKQTCKMRDDIRKKHSHLKSLKTAFPIRIALLKLESDLEIVAGFPDLPIGWLEEVIRLQQEKNTAQNDQEEAQKNANIAEEQLTKLKIDPILNRLEDFKNLEILKVRFEATNEELSQLRTDLHEIELDLDLIQQKLGVDKSCKLDDFFVPDDTINQLKKLLQEEELLKQKLENTEQEFSKAKTKLQQALKDKERFSAPNENVLELSTLFNRYDKKEDPQQRVFNARKALSQKNRDIEEELKNLAPWKGCEQEIRDFKSLTIAQADNWSERAKEFKQKLKDRKLEQKRCEQDYALNRETVKSLSSYSIEISDVSAKNSFDEREKTWGEHKQRLDIASADAFEKALRNDDNIRDKRLIATDQLLRLRSAEEQLGKSESTLKFFGEEIEGIEKELEKLRNEMQPSLANAKLPNNFEAELLPNWVKDFQRVSKLVKEKDECGSELSEAEKEFNQQQTVLLQALRKIGVHQLETLDLGELRAITKAYLEKAMTEQGQRDGALKAVLTAEQEEINRNQDFERASIELKEWKTIWEQALEKCWFKEKTPDQIRSLLHLFKDLASKLVDRKKNSQKINQKENDQEKFFESVSNLLLSLKIKDDDDKMAQFLKLQKRLNEAQEIEKERTSINKDLQQFKKQCDKTKQILFNIEKRVQQMAAYFSLPESAATLDCVAIALKQAQKKNEIEKFISEKELSLFQHLGVENRSDADGKFASIILSEIDKSLTDIEGVLQEVEKDFENRVEERRDVRHNIEKIGGDGSIALLSEERQSILLEIAKKANRALALHLGLIAAEHALAAYRDHHRSELLMQTTNAFKAITDGAFSRLTTQSDQAGDRLIAIRSNGRSIAADAMSKGTRYQLYLALRLAAYRRFCTEDRTLPFIGDDIMETFDDRRSELAIRQLSEMAKHGQVLYFTHHRHLCDIAKRVCGDQVTIHEIPKHRTLQ